MATPIRTGSIPPWMAINASKLQNPQQEEADALSALGEGASGAQQSQMVAGLNPEPMAAAGQPVVPSFPSTPDVVRGPQGTKNKNSATSDTTNKRDTNKSLFLSPEEYSKLIQNAESNPAIQEQRQGVDNLQGLLQMQASEPIKQDLTPLLQLADSLTKGKTNYAGGYAKPESAAARNKMIMDSAMELQKRRGDISKSVLDAVKSQKSGSEVEQMLQKIALAQIKGWDPTPPRAVGTGNPSANASRFLRDFQNNPTVKPYTDTINASRDILASVEHPDWLNDKTLITKLVSAAHLAPVSDRDVKEFSGDPSLLANFNRMIGRLGEGKNLTPEDRGVIKQYAQLTSKKNERVVDQISNDYADTQGKEYGYEFSHAKRLLKPAMVTSQTGADPHVGGKTKEELMKMTDAELSAYEKSVGVH